MNKYYVYNKDFKIWMHKSPLKLVLNPILRKIQWFTDRPYVIVSQTEFIGFRERKPLGLQPSG